MFLCDLNDDVFLVLTSYSWPSIDVRIYWMLSSWPDGRLISIDFTVGVRMGLLIELLEFMFVLMLYVHELLC